MTTPRKKPCRICTLLEDDAEKRYRGVPHDPKRMHTDTNSTESAIVAKNVTKRTLVSGNATVRYAPNFTTTAGAA